MPNPHEAEHLHEEAPLEPDPIREEALQRAHDRLSPDSALDPLASVDLYVEAFLAGARYADERRSAP